MIVVAIIGILASVAIPQYQTYIARTDAMSTVSTATRNLQNAVSEYVATYGAIPASFTELMEVNFLKSVAGVPTAYVAADLIGKNYSEVAYLAGVITVTFDHENANIAKTTFIINAALDASGSSTFAGNGGTLDPKYWPKMN